jgi:hypothetical protein
MDKAVAFLNRLKIQIETRSGHRREHRAVS